MTAATTELEKLHRADLDSVSKQLREFHLEKKKVRVYRGSTNSTRPQKFKKGEIIDVSGLNRILFIDKEKKYALVEPNVPMDALVEETLKFGLVPPVVMEFPGITVGGGIQGGAGESSSFKQGLFHDCCEEYEIVLGNGDVVRASREKNSDLFWGTACSYGSLGIITLVKLRLAIAKDFVHLTYHTVKNFDEAVSLMRKKIGEAFNFIDAILFEKNRGVIMVGNFADKKDLPISTFSKATNEWFYLHADKISEKYSLHEEIIPIRDYLFRYDRGAFWMGKCGFNFLKIPFNRLTRFVFNPFCRTREMYRLLHAANFSQYYLIQDIGLPKKSATKFLEYVASTLHIYPIWLIPLKPTTREKLSLNYIPTDLVISIGIWGEVNQNYSRFAEINRGLEKTIKDLDGRKWLYAHQYYTPEEFWKIYDRKWYNVLRKKYHAEHIFPDVYEKTHVSGTYKKSILKGLLNVIKSPFKLPVS